MAIAQGGVKLGIRIIFVAYVYHFYEGNEEVISLLKAKV
jgi:hypothetical protein